MSDSDDGFDEEAVREELQGATMTNDHCDRCGSPLFRQDGQTFCPNCQHAAQQAQADQGQGQQSQSQGQNQRAQGQSQQPQSREDENSQPRPQGADRSADDASPAGQQRPPTAGRTAGRRTPPSQQDGERAQPRQPGRDAASDTPARDDPSNRDLPEHAPTATASGPAGDALESTIAALARRAASADDPRTAREYLEAAREAAEALAALR